jgi:hypothetical protein
VSKFQRIEPIGSPEVETDYLGRSIENEEVVTASVVSDQRKVGHKSAEPAQRLI